MGKILLLKYGKYTLGNGWGNWLAIFEQHARIGLKSAADELEVSWSKSEAEMKLSWSIEVNL